jgi:tRNA(Ile)-lysidine synthase
LQAATGLDQGGEVLPGPMAVGLAVSGGGDSMALLHLLAAPRRSWAFGSRWRRWTTACAPNPPTRPPLSRGPAPLGLRHDTLPWTDHPVTGNLMQAASEARRALLAAWAQQRGLARVPWPYLR